MHAHGALHTEFGILVASLSFQLPGSDGLGTGFLILSLILDFSDLTTPLTRLLSSRPVAPSEFVGVSIAH